MNPRDELFEIAKNEPRLDLFLAYLSGRLQEAACEMLVDYYNNDWSGRVPNQGP